MPTWIYRVALFLANDTTCQLPTLCHAVTCTFGTEREASTAARRAFPGVRRQAAVLVSQHAALAIPCQLEHCRGTGLAGRLR